MVRSGWAVVGSCWGLFCGWWWCGLGVVRLVCWRVRLGPCRALGRVGRCCGSGCRSGLTAASSEEGSGRGSSDVLCAVGRPRTRSRWWVGALSASVGEARPGAPWAGSSGKGVDRPGPSPASPPSGGSGPGVGLGEVLQGPRPPPRPARCGRAPGGGGLPRGPLQGGGPQRWGGLVVPAQAHGHWAGARRPWAGRVQLSVYPLDLKGSIRDD